MKYFIIEGKIDNSIQIDENIMNEHIAHSKKAIDRGLILMSGLKSDMSGGMSIMKANSIEEVETYLAADPLKISGSQEYKVIEFTPHYFQNITIE